MKTVKVWCVATACTVAGIALSSAAFTQAVPAAKETGHAIAEKSREGADNVKGAFSSQPKKSMYKAKAHYHKARAHEHAHDAKEDAHDAIH
jgi:hypothetical protein